MAELVSSWPDKARFWHWSLALYPQVKTICLQWQDHYGANVNLLLLLLFLKQQQRWLTPGQILTLQQQVSQHNTLFTRPLRHLRRQLPAHLDPVAADALKQSLLQAELCSEQLEQQLLITTLTGFQPSPEPRPVTQMLSVYLHLLQSPPTAPAEPIPPMLGQQMIDLDQAASALLF